MRLNPIDIERQEFQQTWRGYDQDAVRVFLSRVAHQLTLSLNEQEQSLQRVASLEAELSQLKSHEGELRDALLSLDQVGRSLKGQAEREAELIIKEAELRAEQIVAEGRAQLFRMREEEHSLRRQKERVTAELRALLESHLQMLENREERSTERQQRSAQREEPWSSSAQGQPVDALREAQALTASLAAELEVSDEEAEEPMNLGDLRVTTPESNAEYWRPQRSKPRGESPRIGREETFKGESAALDEALIDQALSPVDVLRPTPLGSKAPLKESEKIAVSEDQPEAESGVMGTQRSGVAALKEILARGTPRRHGENTELPRAIAPPESD